MTDKEQINKCECTCDECGAECEPFWKKENKEQIIIDGVDVSECEYVCNTAFGNIGCKLPFNEEIHCCNIPNCYFKQLQKEKFENLNNRQMVESAENLIYENSELIKNLKEKEQECEELQVAYNKAQDILGRVNRANELKSYSLQESIKECEELKKETINKNEKIKELRFSVSDLTNRLCYLNAEKSFRIVDLEQTLNEIKSIVSSTLDCGEWIGQGDNKMENILNIINKVKDGKQ